MNSSSSSSSLRRRTLLFLIFHPDIPGYPHTLQSAGEKLDVKMRPVKRYTSVQFYSFASTRLPSFVFAWLICCCLCIGGKYWNRAVTHSLSLYFPAGAARQSYQRFLMRWTTRWWANFEEVGLPQFYLQSSNAVSLILMQCYLQISEGQATRWEITLRAPKWLHRNKTIKRVWHLAKIVARIMEQRLSIDLKIAYLLTDFWGASRAEDTGVEFDLEGVL